MQQLTYTFSELRYAADTFFDDQLMEFFEPDETLNYQVYTPADLNPTGVFLYVSPKPGARMPDAWREVFDRHGLMWVGAENSGNDIHVARRVGMALLGMVVARKQFGGLDRFLLGGFSGGGRVASMMMPAYPTLFAGALFICGANPLFTATESALAVLEKMPMVFLTGTGDFNLEDTRMAISTYEQAGLPSQLMVVDGLGHALPEAQDLDSALSKLLLPNRLS